MAPKRRPLFSGLAKPATDELQLKLCQGPFLSPPHTLEDGSYGFELAVAIKQFFLKQTSAVTRADGTAPAPFRTIFAGELCQRHGAASSFFSGMR